ncbi:MAG: helix-hairpin-helix domain-containing protein [Thermodesulfobacteriota bacterium]
MNTNRRVANLFSEIALMLEIQDANVFKIRAYKNAADVINTLDTDLADMSADGAELTSIKGIGKDMAAKIDEFLRAGELSYHTELRSEVGGGLIEMSKLRGVGPKTVRLFSSAGIKTVDELESRLKSEGLEGVSGVGKKKSDAILEAVKFYKSNLSVHRLGGAVSGARSLREEISLMEGVSRVSEAGCVRRMTETVSEIELLASFESGGCFDKSLFLKRLSALPGIESVSEARTENPETVTAEVSREQAEIKTFVHATSPARFARELVRLTGSPLHWEKLVSLGSAQDSEDEESFYSSLGLQFIAPELREDTGEIEAAAEDALPRLVESSDIKGDLHTHTLWSDGKDSVEAMALAAREMGYEYIALTDHSPSSVVANGLSAARLASKMEEVKEVNSRLRGVEILTGTEVDIKPDGSLDYPDDILRKLDFVVASIHGSFSQTQKEMTGRVVRALENPFVHALGHPTARVIGRRAPCEMDMDKVTDAALGNGKALEINASCHRLDLKDKHVRMAVEKGVKLIISTDAHSTRQFREMVCGVAVARRGWAGAGDFLNTLALADLLDWLKSRG